MKRSPKNKLPSKWKEFHELMYWKSKKRKEETLTNNHYEKFYTRHFNITPEFYTNKVLLDIGCGPRGSLEWADMAARRIGLDTLANKYLELGAVKHKMEYLNAGAESIPLEDGACDAIFAFNALDHVEDVNKSIQEIKRCLKKGGIFLLIVEVNHKPTICEPHNLSPQNIIEAFSPHFEWQQLKVFKAQEGKGTYTTISSNTTFSNPLNCKELGWMSVKFVKN